MPYDIHAALRNYLDKPCRITINGAEDSISFFVYQSLGDETRDELDNYFFDESLKAAVRSGELLPLAVLGLSDRPASFAELNNGGTLFWKYGQSNGGAVWFASDDSVVSLRPLGDRLEDLGITVKDEANSAPPPSDQDILTSPPYAERWERLGELYRSADYAAALELCVELIAAVPGGNDQLYTLKALIHADSGQSAEALQEAQNIYDISLGDPVAAEFLGRIQIRVGEWAAARATAEAFLDQLDEDASKKLRAAGLAIKGIAAFELGDKELAKECLTAAKSLHTLVTLKYPQVRALLEVIG